MTKEVNWRCIPISKIEEQSGKPIRQPAEFPYRVLGGGTGFFPASKACFHVRFALSLLFSGFALRPRGHTPLEPPIDLKPKSIKRSSFLGLLPLRGTMPARLRMASSSVCLIIEEIVGKRRRLLQTVNGLLRGRGYDTLSVQRRIA